MKDSSDFKTPVQSIKLKEVCPECGKEKPTKGSLTNWLFVETKCSCQSALSLSEGEVIAATTSDVRQHISENLVVLEVLGEGGMGTVYKVRDEALGRDFAIKILKPELAKNKQAVIRFRQEAKAASQLTHPNMAATYSQGMTATGAPFLLMDFIDGTNLEKELAKDAISEERALDILIQTAEALSHAHSKGIVHRDVKPSNVLLARNERDIEVVKLVDFGIAKVVNAKESEQQVTRTGEVFGSPAYMSPEQCLGERIDGRSDVYSLGLLAYEMLEGIVPFLDENPIKTILNKVSGAVPVPKNIASSSFSSIVTVALQSKPNARYDSMDDLLQDLIAVRDGSKPVHAERKLADIRSTSDLQNNLSSGLPRTDMGLVVTGAATACGVAGFFSAPVMFIGFGLAIIAAITWCSYIFRAMRTVVRRNLNPGYQQKFSPWLALSIGLFTSFSIQFEGFALAQLAIAIANLFGHYKPIWEAQIAAGHAATAAPAATLFVICCAASLILAIFGTAFFVAIVNTRMFQFLANSLLPVAKLDKKINLYCLLIGLTLTLPTLVAAATMGGHNQLSDWSVNALAISASFFAAFICISRLLREIHKHQNPTNSVQMATLHENANPAPAATTQIDTNQGIEL